MPHWSEAAVTKAGIAMLNEMMAGRRLTLTSAAGGAGRAGTAWERRKPYWIPGRPSA